MKIVQKFAISKITSRLQATFSYVNQKILIKEKWVAIRRPKRSNIYKVLERK